MEQKFKEAIALEFKQAIDETVETLVNRSQRKREVMDPFRHAVLSNEGMFWARFEKTFQTHFDKKRLANISKYVALAFGATNARTEKSTIIKLSKGEIQNVARHFSLLTSKGLKRRPEWTKDLNSVQAYKPERDVEVSVVSDLWYEKDGRQHFIRLIPGKPTQQQAIYAKADMLHLKLADPECHTYVGLYYNPFGENKKAYRHQPPREVFDMKNDEPVLIGKEYWTTLGDENTMEKIIGIAREVSEKERERLTEIASKLRY
jgi:hypothetical protein